jgi:zinc transporter 1/2/3
MARCVDDTARALACRDGQAAAHLKLISIWVIFFTSVVGISSPVLLARYFQGKPLYDKAVLVIKCFAAGVIMSTSLVHVLPDAFDALSDCRVASSHPWRDFPFSGLVTMVGALLALLVDITASSHVEHSQGPRDHYAPVPALTQEELMETKKPAESRCESGELGPSHDQRVDELVRLKQRLVSQVVEKRILIYFLKFCYTNLLYKLFINLRKSIKKNIICL